MKMRHVLHSFNTKIKVAAKSKGSQKMAHNMERTDVTILVNYLLENYKTGKIVFYKNNKCFSVIDHEIEKIRILAKDGKPCDDYIVEPDGTGEGTIIYNAYDLDGHHVYKDDANGTFQKVAELEKLCRAKYRKQNRIEVAKQRVGVGLVLGVLCGAVFLFGALIDAQNKKDKIKKQTQKEQLKQEILKEYGLDTVCMYQKVQQNTQIKK